MRFFRFFITVLVLLISIKLAARPVERLFYSSFRPEGWDIYLSRDHGKTFKRFTDHPALDYDAAISPNGKWVVFTSERGGKPRLYIKSLNKDTRPRLLVQSHSMQDQVAFSPDGRFIVFVSSHLGNAEICKLPFQPYDTLDIAQAVNLTNHQGGDFRPSYSPDGKRIAFSSDRAHEVKPHPRFSFAVQRTGDVYLMDSKGNETSRLTDSEYWEGSPEWSANGEKLYFYGLRSGIPRIYSMNVDGSQQTGISPDGIKAVSPLMIGEKEIAFTTWTRNLSGPFKLMKLNMETGSVEPFYQDEVDMLNLKYHETGLLTFHGGPKPEPSAVNLGGFDGDLMIKGGPYHYQMPNRTLKTFGVRRAFAAPADPNGPHLVYGFMLGERMPEAITWSGYALLLFPLLTILFMGMGIYYAIKRRKRMRPWEYIGFTIVFFLLMFIVLGGFVFSYFIQFLSYTEVRSYLIILFALLAIASLFSYRTSKRKLKRGRPVYHVYNLLTTNLVVNTFFALYIALFSHSFINLDSAFYRVNYDTNEVEHIFTRKADKSRHPLHDRILDVKYSPEGSTLLFSVGSFFGDTAHPGDLIEYDFQSKTQQILSDSDANDGFGDVSLDGSRMVYRSTRTGNPDIYLKEGDQLTNLTGSEARESFPVISQVGDKIAYCSDTNGVMVGNRFRTVDIYLKRLEDNGNWSDPIQLTSYEGQEAHPHFSPDGEWLIYTSEEFGIFDEQPLIQPFIFSPQMYGEIVALRLSDGHKIRLTHNKWEDGAPLWVRGIKEKIVKQ